MASHEYYNDSSWPRPPPSYHDEDYHQSPTESPYTRRTSQTRYHPQYQDYTHQPQYSQNSLADDAFVGGRNHPADQYGEDIPLKPNAQATQPPDSHWMNDNTNYDAGMPMDPAMGSRRRRRRSKKKGNLKKPIPWVTYLLTAIDIGVFIGELIRSGKSLANPTIVLN